MYNRISKTYNWLFYKLLRQICSYAVKFKEKYCNNKLRIVAL